MKKLIPVIALVFLTSCNAAINENDGDASDTTKVDSILEKIDTTIDKGVDTLQKKFNDATDRDDRDTTKK